MTVANKLTEWNDLRNAVYLNSVESKLFHLQMKILHGSPD